MIFTRGSKGQIVFKEVRQAMDAAGFSSRQLGSSAFLFQHREKQLASIQFHVNHGTQDAKLDRVKLANMAASLKRAYGWNAGTFFSGE